MSSQWSHRCAALAFKGVTDLSEDKVFHAFWSACRMYVGHFKDRPDRLDSVQIDRAEMFVILVRRIHCRILWCPRGPDYTAVERISSKSFGNSNKTSSSIQ